MRGLDTAYPFFRLGLSWSSVGRRSDDRPHNGFQEFPCRGPRLHFCTIDVCDYPPILIATEGAVGRSSAPVPIGNFIRVTLQPESADDRTYGSRPFDLVCIYRVIPVASVAASRDLGASSSTQRAAT